jgi:hypothetical protein
VVTQTVRPGRLTYPLLRSERLARFHLWINSWGVMSRPRRSSGMVQFYRWPTTNATTGAYVRVCITRPFPRAVRDRKLARTATWRHEASRPQAIEDASGIATA